MATVTSVTCGVCAFGDGADADDTHVTAAFALVFSGASVHHVARRAAARARKSVVPNASAYCARCRCVTWLARAPALFHVIVQQEREHAVGICVQCLQQSV